MKKVILPLAMTALSMFGFSQLNAQDTNVDAHDLTVVIPAVALLDIELNAAITLSPDAPIEAGDPIDFASATDETLWLNYSSIVGTATNPSRKVTVAATGTLPAGSKLKVTAGAASVDGAGTKGASAGEVIFNALATDYDVITGIGSCYTGDGADRGHNLAYSLELDNADYGNLNYDDDYTVTLTYTLSDN